MTTMSLPDAFFQHVPPQGGRGVVIDRPGVVQSIGRTLNCAFGQGETLPDDLAELLGQLDALDQSDAR